MSSRTSGSSDLDRLVALRGVLAWLLPLVATVFTAVFFVLMSSGSSWISRPFIGRYGSLAIVMAIALLTLFVVCVVIYSRVSTAIERHDRSSGSSR